MKQQAFTLVETLVAISILLITVLGPISIITKYFNAAEYIKNQITATQLAQEGVELIMALRDYNINTRENPGDLSSPPRAPFLDLDDCFSPNVCDVSIESLWDYSGWVETSHSPLKTGSGGHSIYNHASASTKNSIFTRIITLDTSTVKDSNGEDLKLAKVTVEVAWTGRTNVPAGKATISTYIYDKVF